MEGLPGLPEPLAKRAHAAAEWLGERRDQDHKVTVVHHIDADGVSAGAIAMRCLERAGIRHDGLAARSLDDVHLKLIAEQDTDALWFCDFGSTAYMHFDMPRLVCDHHELVRDGTEEDFPHINPLLDDLPGDSISGAGCAYLAAVAMDSANLDLAPVALVGATGDLQDRKGGFTGSNLAIQHAGEASNLLDVEPDLAYFGVETRTLPKLLAYGDEPKIPGMGTARDTQALLNDLKIPLKHEGKDRSWAHLDGLEKETILDALVHRLIDCGLHERAEQLLRPVVRIQGEEPGSPVRELREYGTLLNSTARYGEPEVGLAVAMGDRDAMYKQALGLRDDHRKNLVKYVSAFSQAGVQDSHATQWVNVGDKVRDTVVGIVCGMALGGLDLRRDRPLLAFAHTPDGLTKVSSRAPDEIQSRIDLATAMRDACAVVGGQGGGHKGAAGATIPRGSEQEFLAEVDRIVATQLGIGAAPAPKVEPSPGSHKGWSQKGTGQTRLL